MHGRVAVGGDGERGDAAGQAIQNLEDLCRGAGPGDGDATVVAASERHLRRREGVGLPEPPGLAPRRVGLGHEPRRAAADDSPAAGSESRTPSHSAAARLQQSD